MKSNHKYVLQSSILFLIYVMFVKLLLSAHLSIFTYVLCFAMLIPCRYLLSFFADRSFIGILSKELDAKKYYDAINHKYLRLSIIYKLNAEWLVGDYRRLIIMSTAGFKSSRRIRSKCIFLSYLARAYFDIRDYENLSKTVDVFFKLQQNNKKSQKILANYTVFQYYKAYLDKDFEQCVFLTEMRKKKINNDRYNGKLQSLINNINLGIAYYELGDMEKAKAIFQWFIEASPNLNALYEISVMYINAIEGNCLPCSKVHVEEDDAMKNAIISTEKQIKRNKLTLFILISILIGAFVVFSCIEYIEYSKAKDEYIAAVAEYEKDMNEAMERNYPNGEVLVNFNVKKDKQYIDNFGIINTGKRIDLVNVHSINNGENIDFTIIVKKVKIGKYYCEKSPVTNYYIGFKIYDEKKNAKDFYHVVEFTYENTKYWFVIDYIGETPKK